jgi:hypothetical protein
MTRILSFLLVLLTVAQSAFAVPNVLLAIRGTQTDAWYSTGGKTMYPVMFNSISDPVPGVVVANATSGVFGSSVIDNKTNGNYIEWPGYRNGPTASSGFSVIARFVPRTSTPLAAPVPLLSFGRASEGYQFVMFVDTTNKVFVRVTNPAGSNLVSLSTTGTVTLVAGTPTEIAFSWTGGTGAGGVNLSQSGVSINSTAAAGAYSGSSTIFYDSIIWGADVAGLGGGTGGANSPYLNELLIFDAAQSVVYSARTGFWNVSQLDGTFSTDPGVDSVLTSAGSYYINGVLKTPTWIAAATSDVKHGVAFGASSALLGTYRGADLWTALAAASIKHGVTQTQDGSLVTGVYDGSDLYTAATAPQLKLGVSLLQNGALITGTYDGSDRWSDPTAAKVKIGTTYKANSTIANQTGTYDGSDRWTALATTDVRQGLAYSSNSTSLNQTGALDLPSINDVRSTVTYDGGTKTGAYLPITNITKLAKLQPKNAPARGRVGITQGDQLDMRFKAMCTDLVPCNITGATITTAFQGIGGDVVIPFSQHTIDPDQVGHAGEFTLHLLSSDTVKFKAGLARDMVSTLNQGGFTVAYHGYRIVDILKPSPRQ